MTDLPGWFDYEDLYRSWAHAATSASVMVELGVYAGRSLVFLALACFVCGKKPRIYGVDRFDEIPIEKVSADLLSRGVNPDTVTLIQSDSADAAGRFADGSVDFLFIDADHSYEGVQRDIAAWRPKMRPGGIMAGHDRVRDGVHRAVIEAFGQYRTSGPLAWWVQV